MYGNVVVGTYVINDKSTYMSYDKRLRDVMEENTSYIDYAYRMDNFKALGLLNPFRVYKIRPVYEPFATSAYSASSPLSTLFYEINILILTHPPQFLHFSHLKSLEILILCLLIFPIPGV